MRLLLATLLSLSTLSSFAQSQSCQALQELDRQARQAKLQAEILAEYFENVSEISRDAQRLNQISSGIAITSAALALGTGAYLGTGFIMGAAGSGARTLGITYANAHSAMSSVKTLYAGKYSIGGMVGGAVLGIPTRALLGEMAGNVAMAVGYFAGIILASPVDSYLMGQGIYSLISDGQTVQVKAQDLLKDEAHLQQLIQTDGTEIQKLIENPPAAFENSYKLGRPMRDQMTLISAFAQRRAEAALLIYQSRQLEAELMKKACAL